MPRTKIELPYTSPFNETKRTIENILNSNGYNEKQLKSGELVWKSGNGLLTAMKFIKVEYSEDKVVLTGWVQSGIGSVGGGEMSLEGAVAIIPKKSVMKVIEQIKNGLR